MRTTQFPLLLLILASTLPAELSRASEARQSSSRGTEAGTARLSARAAAALETVFGSSRPAAVPKPPGSGKPDLPGSGGTLGPGPRPQGPSPTFGVPTVPATDPHEPVVPEEGMRFGEWRDVVEIEVPPGPAGFQASVSLVASHLAGDGPLGRGWSLLPDSAILRRSDTGGVAGSSVEDDTYLLDGTELVRVLGSLILPVAQMQDREELYEPATADGSRLRYEPSDNTWTLYRDGWIYRYGSGTGTGANATQHAPLDLDPRPRERGTRAAAPGGAAPSSASAREERTAGGRRPEASLAGSGVSITPGVTLQVPCLGGDSRCSTHAWRLSKITDPHGNFLTYDYGAEPLPADLYSGYGARNHHVRLETIRASNGARVELDYGPRPDPRVSYASGLQSVRSERLQEIRSYAESGQIYSHYRIEYQDEGGVDCKGNPMDFASAEEEDDLVDRPVQTLLRRIVRIATAGHLDAGTERQIRCVKTAHEEDAWSRPELLTGVVTTGLEVNAAFTRVLPIPAQLDGDGVTDLILLAYRQTGEETWEAGHRVYRAEPNSRFSPFESEGEIIEAWQETLDKKLTGEAYSEDRGHTLADFNGDGWLDLLYEKEDEEGETGDVRLSLWNPNRQGFGSERPNVRACALRYSTAADIDGDSLPDLVRLSHPGDEICGQRRHSEWLPNLGRAPYFDTDEAGWRDLHTPAPQLAKGLRVRTFPGHEESKPRHFLESQSRILDLNGDGLSDLAYAFYADWELHEADSTQCQDLDLCGWIPAPASDFSRIYWGDGKGSFVDSGLSAGPPLLRLIARSDPVEFPVPIVPRAEVSMLQALDLGRRGAPALVSAPASGSHELGISLFRGILHGFGSSPASGEEAGGLPKARFVPPLTQDPRAGDGCYEVGSYPAFADFDGDGFLDLLDISINREDPQPGCGGSQWCVRLHRGQRKTSQGRIVQSDSSWGGRTKLKWGFSAEYPNANRQMPINVEVVREIDGAEGKVERRYGRGVFRDRAFRGFGVVGRLNLRGGLDRFAFGLTPALEGRLLYASRQRHDNTLERVTVLAYGVPEESAPACGAPGCQPAAADRSSYALDVRPPYFNPERRRCEYEVERSGRGEQATEIHELIAHCHRWGGRKAPAHGQLLAAAGLYAYPTQAWPSYHASARAWREGTTDSSAVLGTRPDPAGEDLSLWTLAGFVAIGEPIEPRWPAPPGMELPPEMYLEELYRVRAEVLGQGFSAHIVDHEYALASRRRSRTRAHRDVSTTADDLVTDFEWEGVSPAVFSPRIPFQQRLVRSTRSDASGTVLQETRFEDFDPDSFANAGTVITCGRGGRSCRTERRTWHGNGELASYTRPDGLVEGRELAWCQSETQTDALGRERQRTFDDRCRLETDLWLGVETRFVYDGQNRVRERTVDSNGSSPPFTLTSYQDDELSRREDKRYREPRLARLGSDGYLELHYLDGFGRLTKRVGCQAEAPASGAWPTCVEGPRRVLEWTGYGEDGQPILGARPYTEVDGNAQQAVVSRWLRDGYGRILVERAPAHVDLASEPRAWTTLRRGYAPGRALFQDGLGRLAASVSSTLSRVRTQAGQTVFEEKLDRLGLVTSRRERDGIEELYGYADDHQLETVTLAGTADCVGAAGALEPCTHQETMVSDAMGRLIRRVAADGTAATTTWDAIGRPLVKSRLDAQGNVLESRSWRYGETPEGLQEVVSVGPLGLETVRLYDGLQRLEKETLGDGRVQEWTRGQDGRPERVMQMDGSSSQEIVYTYDPHGDLASQTTPAGGTTTWTHNAAGQPLSETDEYGVTTTRSYLFSGFEHERRRTGDGFDWLLERNLYDVAGRATWRWLEGVLWSFLYDDLDRVAWQGEGNQAVGTATHFVYEGTSDRLLRTERYITRAPFLSVSHQRHDAWGRLIEATDPDGGVTLFERDVVGRPRFATDPEGRRTERRYDALGRLTFETLSGRNSATIAWAPDAYDYRHSTGRVEGLLRTDWSDAGLHTTRRWNDTWGRPVAAERPDGSRQEWVYDGGRLTDVYELDARGRVLRRTGYEFNDRSQLSRQLGPAQPGLFSAMAGGAPFGGYSVDWDYSAGGRLESVTAAGESTLLFYGPDGMLEREEFRGLVRRLYREESGSEAYPRVSRETLGKDRPGAPLRETVHVHDAAGRVVGRTTTDPDSTVVRWWEDFDFFAQARREGARVDGVDEVVHEWSYSLAGRPLERRTEVLGQGPFLSRWSWLGNGEPASVQGPSGAKLVYDYGPTYDGELDAVRSGAGRVLARVETREARGRITSLELEGGDRLHFGWDELGRLKARRRVAPDGSEAHRWRGEYDALGRLVEEVRDLGGQRRRSRYRFDASGYLLREAHEIDGVREALDYEVDAAGRRLSTTGTWQGIDHGMSTTWDLASPAQRLTQVESGGVMTEIHYDAWEAVTQDQHGHAYTRTPEGMIRTIDDGSQVRTIYRDAGGMPVAVAEDGELRLTAWGLDGGGRPIDVRSAAGETYTYLEVEGLSLGRMLHQGLGLTGALPQELLTDTRGSLVGGDSAAAPGTAFGVGFTVGAQDERFLFQGMESLPGVRDVHLARFRGYDAQTGRFLRPDPIGLGGGYHRTRYASGDPVNITDPLGLSDCKPEPADFGSLPNLIPSLETPFIQGADGGAASPFGPGVPVVYRNPLFDALGVPLNAAEDSSTKTAETSSTGTTGTSGGAVQNPDSDTDANPGSDNSQSLLEGYGGFGSPESVTFFTAMVAEIVIEPEPEPAPPPEPPPEPPPQPEEPTPPQEERSLEEQLAREALDIATDLTPVPFASTAKEIGNMMAGKNLITDEPYTAVDYVVGVGSVLADTGTGGAAGGAVVVAAKTAKRTLRAAGAAGKHADKTIDFAKATERWGDEITDLSPGFGGGRRGAERRRGYGRGQAPHFPGADGEYRLGGGTAEPVRGKPSSQTMFGVERNNPQDWRDFRDTLDDIGAGDVLSRGNRWRIDHDLVPRVDRQWRENFPDAKAQGGHRTGEPISIHHINNRGQVEVLPRTQHLQLGHGGNYSRPGGASPSNIDPAFLEAWGEPPG